MKNVSILKEAIKNKSLHTILDTLKQAITRETYGVIATNGYEFLADTLKSLPEEVIELAKLYPVIAETLIEIQQKTNEYDSALIGAEQLTFFNAIYMALNCHEIKPFWLEQDFAVKNMRNGFFWENFLIHLTVANRLEALSIFYNITKDCVPFLLFRATKERNIEFCVKFAIELKTANPFVYKEANLPEDTTQLATIIQQRY